MAEGKGDRIRELKVIDRQLVELDLECGDWFRHQTAKVRTIREKLKAIIDSAKEEPPQN